MKKQSVLIIALVIFVMSACKKNSAPAGNENPGGPNGGGTTPFTITSFTPVHALPGGTVTIIGTNLSAVKTNDTVLINGMPAAVSAASATQLSVTVPDSASKGRIFVTIGAESHSPADSFEVLLDIPRNGLVAFYPFTGNANDNSSNQLNGTPGGATLSTDRYGNTNSAYSFDGSSSYIDLGNTTTERLSGAITVAMWINPAKLDGYLLSKTGTTPYDGYDLSIQTVGSVGRFGLFAYESGTGTNYLSASFPINQWIFLAGTLDGTNIANYANGQSLLSQSNNRAFVDDAASELILGATSTHDAFFYQGVMDDVAIYNRALTPGEILQLYNQTVTKYNN
jgi:hypothetical protein